LGLLYLTFPSAMHSRFEHCLGVAYQAINYLQIIEKNHNLE